METAIKGPCRILIISDSHGRLANLQQLMKKMKSPDLTIHCGDLEALPEDIERIVGSKLVYVRGNCDFSPSLPLERELMIDRYKVLVTHGNRYGVSGTPLILQEEAKGRGYDMALFGHTHRPYLNIGSDITLANPGSISLPRQDNGRASYLIMEIDRAGEAHFHQNYL